MCTLLHHCSCITKALIKCILLQQNGSSPKPSVKRIESLNGPVEKLTGQDQDSLLCSVSEREPEPQRARESYYIHALSWGVHVMKTGHSRVAGTVGAFPGVSGGTVLDICSACEPNQQNVTKAAMWGERVGTASKSRRKSLSHHRCITFLQKKKNWFYMREV